MQRQDGVILGVNLQFLYPASMTDAEAHTRSMASYLDYAIADSVDCWLWPERARAREELRLLREGGRIVNYNVGSRFGEEPMQFTAKDAGLFARSRDRLWRELDYAMECGAKRIVVVTGDDVPEDRQGAKARVMELFARAAERLPEDAYLALEATDRDVDKRALLGPVDETCAFIHGCWAGGNHHIGMLLDMGHIPLLHTTIPEAIRDAEDTLIHIHLANCILQNPEHPLYGDKHVAWNDPAGEYTQDDAKRMVRLLKQAGYYRPGERQTTSFEMRPFPGWTAADSVREFIRVFDEAWNEPAQEKN